jgi:hypothetical protein
VVTKKAQDLMTVANNFAQQNNRTLAKISGAVLQKSQVRNHAFCCSS